MHRVGLFLAVWALLATIVIALAALARPEAGPPMPRETPRRAIESALVPERNVQRPVPRKVPAPSELSGTSAPRTEPAEVPATVPEAVPETVPQPAGSTARAPAETPDRGVRPARSPTQDLGGEAGIPGLGVLPRGVPAEEEGLGVHVVHSGGQPAFDAEVRWVQQGDLDRLRAEGVAVDDLDPADLLALSDRRTRSVAGGFAMLTSERGTMVVDARLGDAYACARIRREDTGHVRLVLHADTTLAVAAVDGAGRPVAGQPIVLRDAECRTIWSARTSAPEGHAVLRHATGAVSSARAGFQDLTVAIDAPGGALVHLPRGAIPVEPVRLVVSPGASVTVRVEDVDGRPCLEPTTVWLAPAGAGACWAGRARQTRDGLALFEGVPPGLALRARASAGCGPLELSTELAAPASAGGTTTLALRHAAAMPRVAGRLVSSSGSPWREFELTAYVRSAQGGAIWTAQGTARTGDDGGFRVDVPALHALAPEERRSLSLVARNEFGRTLAGADLELGPVAVPLRDLGEVRAADWPVHLRGIVLDESDRALPGAFVELFEASGERADPRTRVTCDQRGSFVLRGPPTSGEVLIVRATEPDRRAAEAVVTLRRGEKAARIVIAVHGRLAGSVVLPEQAPSGGLIVRVRQSGGAQLALSVDEGGRFEFAHVEPGDSRLEFLAQGFEEPVLALDHVLVPRGGAAPDERLLAIDLREHLDVLALEVVDERGQPIQSGWIGAPVEGRARGRPFELEDGLARVLVPRGAPAVQVQTQGYEPALLSAPRGRVRVELQPGGG